MQGEIITFYSYKGGTGRSMALANTACLLSGESNSSQGKVLMIDWDLEAPGLHRYFQNQFKKQSGNTVDTENWINNRPGLLDLFKSLNEQIPVAGYGKTEDRDNKAFQHAREIIAHIDLDDYVLQTDINNLHLLKAGTFDSAYARSVNSFDWDDLHSRNRWLFRALIEELTRIDRYRYVLIDSRTGVTDTSNICTTLMPEKLVVVFTPNRQSFTGVGELIKNATRYRLNSDDVRPLAIFPLPSRIESLREQLRKDWRYGNEKAGIEGYQPLFTRLFMEIYQLDENECDLEDYFSEVQIQQSPDFAFGEEIAVNLDDQQDRFSLARSYETFTQKLIHLDLPWERRSPIKGSANDIAQLAERFFGRLNIEDQSRMRRIFTRLVRIALPGEGADTMKGANISEFGASAEPLIQLLVDAGILIRQSASDFGQDTVEVANDALIREWGRLREWINSQRDFLSWRQQLRAYLAEWEKQGRSPDELLTGTSLNKAVSWEDDYFDDLNLAEHEYIAESRYRNKSSLSEAPSSFWKRMYFGNPSQWVPLVLTMIVGVIVMYSWIKENQKSRLTPEVENLTNQGRKAYDAGSPQSAIQFYNQAIEKKSDYASAYLNRGDAYRALNDKEKALVDYEKAIALASNPDVLRLARSARDSLNSPSPTPTPIADLYPRLVYLIVPDSGEPRFQSIEQALTSQGFSVMRTPANASPPPVTEVRYYRENDQLAAVEIVDLLRQKGVSDATLTYLNQQDPVRAWHYEIWLSRNPLAR